MTEGRGSPPRSSVNIFAGVIKGIHIDYPERMTQRERVLLLDLIENVAKLEEYRIKDRKSDFGTALSVIHSRLPREPGLSPDLIRNIVFKLLQNEEQMYPIGALLLSTASFDLAMQGSLCNETLRFVDGIAHDVRHITKNLPPTCSGFGRQKAWECGTDLLKRMSDGLGHRSSSPDALKSQANCLANLSDIHASEGSADGAIAYGKESIDLLNRYSDRPEKSRIYGFSLYNVAWAYYSKGDNGKSLNYYSEALRAFEKAMDMHEDDKKNGSVKRGGNGTVHVTTRNRKVTDYGMNYTNLQSVWQNDSPKLNKNVANGFLGNNKEDNYAELVANLVNSYGNMGRKMSMEVHMLDDRLDEIQDFMGAYSKEQAGGVQFHQDIKYFETRYQGQYNQSMMGDYVWALKRGSDLEQWFSTFVTSWTGRTSK